MRHAKFILQGVKASCKFYLPKHNRGRRKVEEVESTGEEVEMTYNAAGQTKERLNCLSQTPDYKTSVQCQVGRFSIRPTTLKASLIGLFL